jgi:hypothetical protein
VSPEPLVASFFAHQDGRSYILVAHRFRAKINEIKIL